MENIVKKIEEVTKENGLNGKDLANILGLKKTPLTDWKNGKAKPTLEQLIKICEYFGKTPNEITGFNQDNLADQEQELLKYFRNCNAANKQIIISAAEKLQELPAAEQLDANSSASKIG